MTARLLDLRGPLVLAVAAALLYALGPAAFLWNGGFSEEGRVAGWQWGLPVALVLAAVHLRTVLAVLERSSGTAADEGLLARRHDWLAWVVLLTCVYAPAPWWRFDWAATQVFVLIGVWLLARRPVAVAVTVLVSGSMVARLVLDTSEFDLSVFAIGALVAYWMIGFAGSTILLYASVRLVVVQRELAANRVALATTGVDDERARLAREVHDLLGQSLSALTLNGELALAMRGRDPVAADEALAHVAESARAAARGLRLVAVDEHAVTLRDELGSATTLLRAAGVQVDLRAEVPDHVWTDPGPAITLLAWALRESATNVVRHSDASLVTVVLEQHDGATVLVVDNDRPHPGRGHGSGLDGLRDRAGTCGGSVDVEQDRERFRLTVTAPSG